MKVQGVGDDFESDDGEVVYIKDREGFLAATVMPEDLDAVCPWPSVEDTGEERRLRTLPYLHNTVTLRIWELPDFACGCRIWDSGIVLSKYLEYLPSFRENARNKRVIELGTGTGLLGIACWFLGCDVTMTDYDDTVMFLPTENARINCGTDERIRIAKLLWGKDCTFLQPPFDFIIGSDLAYDPECFEDLCRCVLDLSDSRTEIIFCNHRRRAEQALFTEAMEKEFDMEIVSDFMQVLPKEYQVDNLFLYHFKKKTPGH